MPSPRPLPALLSQVLVGFTIEADGEFERAMADAGYPGALFSLLLWYNLMRFVDGKTGVRDLARRARIGEIVIKHQLGCLERWGVITIEEPAHGSAMKRRLGRRDGWGSGRGIRADSCLAPTHEGEHAQLVWNGLPEAIEARWRARLGGAAHGRLRAALETNLADLSHDLPSALPFSYTNAGFTLAPLDPSAEPLDAKALPVLLSQALLHFAIEFDRQAPAPLDLSANIVRVLSDEPAPLNALASLTGLSPETSAVGWREKSLVIIEKGEGGIRGKLVKLSPSGLAAQTAYWKLVAKIERDWEKKFGKHAVARLREALLNLFEPRKGKAPIDEALIPPAQTVRAGAPRAALGRSPEDIGVAGKKRCRDLVAQTEVFLRDPAGSLPHYPRWDRNRGFGP